MANGLSGRKLAAAALLAAAVVALFALWGRERLEAPAPGEAGVTPSAELVATVRSEPRSFNRLVARDRTSHLVSLLTQSRLVRIDLETQELEPALAERWASSPDGLEYTLALRRGVLFSDGTPMTAADVLFSAEALYDERVGSPLAEPLKPGGQPLAFSAPDDHTVVVRFAVPFGPGLRILDNLPILPRHRLEAALRDGKFRDAWGVATPTTELAGLGPFVLESYRPGERMVFARNPHYWRAGPRGERLPLLDRLVVSIVPDQNAEILRLQSGQADLSSSEVRPDDLASIRRAADAGRLVLTELGVGLDPDCLWFNLRPAFAKANPGRQWLQRRELRLAVSAAVDRTAFANTVYLGTAVPVGGPVTPGNRAWFDPAITPPTHDPARAKRLLAEMGFQDENGDGVLDTPGGGPARFTLLTQKGNTLRERGAVFIQEELRKIGLDVAVVTLEQPAVIDRLMKGDYDAIFFGPQTTDTDPAANLDFWLSSGAFHLWNPGQAEPATVWEQQIDDLMRSQLAARNFAERRRLFGEVQRVFADQAPAIYFVAPRMHVAMSPRVAGARPALLQPPILWNADQLAVR